MQNEYNKMQNMTNSSVRGAGLAERPIPLLVRVSQLFTALALSLLLLSGLLHAAGWKNLIQNVFTETSSNTLALPALLAAAAITFSIAVGIALVRLQIIETAFAIRRVEKRRVFGGYRSALSPVFLTICVLAISVAAALSFDAFLKRFPIARQTALAKIDVAVPQPGEELIPIYFWDYSTWVSPKMLAKLEIILPYEKGPPTKYLSKIYLRDKETQQVILELHGKRPRVYSDRTFVENRSVLTSPNQWAKLYSLTQETGTTDSTHALTLTKLQTPQNATLALGDFENGRFVYWSPEGSIFQVRCVVQPCPVARMLELVSFDSDNALSTRGNRLQWTRNTLKRLLTATPTQTTTEIRQAHQNILLLYLISLVTIDPRDAETYFHIGKLAQNRDTLTSAIRYGRDVGLEHAKLVELESSSSRF